MFQKPHEFDLRRVMIRDLFCKLHIDGAEGGNLAAPRGPREVRRDKSENGFGGTLDTHLGIWLKEVP